MTSLYAPATLGLVWLFPTRLELKENFATPKVDLVAGLTVAIVALPLALAFGVSSGLGASSGITTAVLAGFIAAVFGGSRFQVSGPTGAMTVVLLPIVHQFGVDGVLAVGLMAGVLLIVAAISGLGGHIHRIPTAVIEGFTAGIAVVIALQQVPTMLGLKIEPADHVWETAWMALIQWPSIGPVALPMGLACAAVVILVQPRGNKIPVALASVAVASLLATGFGWQVDKIGDLPNLIRMPSGDFLLGVNLWPLVPSAVAVATLAALESLLSAKVADNLAKSPRGHDSNRELFGQGLANLVVPFFGGVPATAALARTAVNVKSHARSRLSAASHSVFLATAVLALPALVAEIPIPALAGVLVGTAVKMIHFRELITLARSSKLDAILLVCTFAVTVALDLISAVVAGVLIFWLLRNTKLSIKAPRESDLD